jgi:uncharacterized membrane protein (UPF0127 family)
MYLSAPLSGSAFFSPRTSFLHLPNGTAVAAQLMSTPAERAAGQQFRSEPSVMLFLHPRPGRYQYHMKNVHFPLDMLSLDSTGAIARLKRMTPGPNSYDSSADCLAVIEAPAGFVLQNSLTMGRRIRF